MRGVIKIEKFGAEFKITKLNREAVPRTKPEPLDCEGGETSGEDGRFDNNISRARSRIFELSACNTWQYFATLTLNPEYDRTDLSAWRKRFVQWVRDYRKKGYSIKYLLVPERHKSGEWHMHGFFSGLPENDVGPFRPADIGNAATDAAVAAYKAAELNKKGFLCWRSYNRKWGYCSLSAVKNGEAAARYITKYITKDIASDSLISGAHLFYASRGLAGAEPIAWNGIPFRSDEEFYASLADCKHFCNEYVEQWWTKDIKNLPELCDYITGEKFEFTD